MGSPRRIIVGALLASVGAIVAIVLLGGARDDSAAHAGAVPAGETTTAVTRRTLTESATVDGTLGYGATLELYDRLSGTFTWLPAVGLTIARGGTLFRVNNLPVVLMYGAVPAYRALKEGVSDGPDVAELNVNLIDLGFDPYAAITDRSHFGEATAAAVRRWQRTEGLAQTGQIEVGRVVFAPDARRVTALHVALGQDPPGGEGSSGSSASDQPAGRAPNAKGAPSVPPGAKQERPPHDQPARKHPSHPQSHRKSPNRPPGKNKPRSAKNSPAQHSPDTERGKESPAPEEHGDPSKPEGGSGAGTAVLTTTSTRQLVQLKLKAEQQQLARLGEQAPVTLPGGEVVQGRIVEVGTVASEGKGGEGEKGSGAGGATGAEGSGESATIPVTLSLRHRVARLDEAPVSVDLVKSVRVDVLAVPATALLATAGGGYAIEVPQGARRVQLPVTPGMFADGYVQVEGRGLYEGQTVFESE